MSESHDIRPADEQSELDQVSYRPSSTGQGRFSAVSRLVRGFGYTALFVVSFFIFLYTTFDFNVLKEAVTASISRESGYNISIDHMSPRLPFGMYVKKVQVQSPHNAQLVIDHVDVGLSLSSLLIGKVAFDLELRSKKGGRFALGGSMAIADLVSGKTSLPSDVDIKAKAFPLDNMVDFMLTEYAQSPDTNPLLAPMLEQLGFRGKLNGDVDFRINTDNPTQSRGKIDIRLSDAVVILSDPGIGLSDQPLTKAEIKADMRQGQLILERGSGLRSAELVLDMNGNVSLAKVLQRSTLNLKVGLQLLESLEENLGIILTAMGGGGGGSVTMEITGQLGAPIVKTF